ncbi:MAG: 1-acyl-sn-glycerol-3-phosphate acyltransferase [Bacteroidales bacterium]|nr:1-acyl-sn-glycerol-3-phosphate acyltransferase [Bacteroidales bacterium]
MDTDNGLKIDVEAVIASKSKRLAKFAPKFLTNWLKRTIHEDELNGLFTKYANCQGVEFAQRCLKDYNVKCNIRYVNKDSISKQGRYIFVSNHPLGGLDGIALIAHFGEFFGNIKFVVNDLLMHVKHFSDIFVPVNKHGSMSKEYAELINKAYSSNAQILYFPAGLCSRLIDGKVQDLDWKPNFIKQAQRYNREIVPIYFSGKNSMFFYRLAKIRKFLGIKFNIEMLFLPDEMFRQKNATFDVIVGEPIRIEDLDKTLSPKQLSAQIREQCYRLKENETYNSASGKRIAD